MTSFGTIRNNTALKHIPKIKEYQGGFGSIRNNTALKRGDMIIDIKIVLEPFETTQL